MSKYFSQSFNKNIEPKMTLFFIIDDGFYSYLSFFYSTILNIVALRRLGLLLFLFITQSIFSWLRLQFSPNSATPIFRYSIKQNLLESYRKLMPHAQGKLSAAKMKREKPHLFCLLLKHQLPFLLQVLRASLKRPMSRTVLHPRLRNG